MSVKDHKVTNIKFVIIIRSMTTHDLIRDLMKFMLFFFFKKVRMLCVNHKFGSKKPSTYVILDYDLQSYQHKFYAEQTSNDEN